MTTAASLALALTAAACSGEGPRESAEPPLEESGTTSTTIPENDSTVATTSTTEAPPPTTVPPTTQPAPVGLAATNARAALTTTGIVVPIVGRDPGAGTVSVGTPCGRVATIRNGFALEGTVVLDAGHGGPEPGAVGPAGLTEKALNLAVAQHAQRALEAAGFPTIQTRAGDYRISLEARAKIAQTVQAKAFVSIHYNAEPDGPRPTPGVETYYQTVGSSAAESRRLSGLIYEETVAAMSRYPDVAWVADTDAGAKFRKNSGGNDYYGIVRRTQGIPGVLAELGFISNPPEEALYGRADVQQVAGEAVARGIVRFLTTSDPGSGFTEPYPRESPAGSGGGSSNCEDPPLE